MSNKFGFSTKHNQIIIYQPTSNLSKTFCVCWLGMRLLERKPLGINQTTVAGIGSKMDVENILWISLFLCQLMASNTVHYLIGKSIQEKPLGFQSIYDSALQDTFLVMRYFGSYLAILLVLSRFEFVQHLFQENVFLLTLATFGYSFGFTCQCISAGCVCNIRNHFEALLSVGKTYLLAKIKKIIKQKEWGSLR